MINARNDHQIKNCYIHYIFCQYYLIKLMTKMVDITTKMVDKTIGRPIDAGLIYRTFHQKLDQRIAEL